MLQPIHLQWQEHDPARKKRLAFERLCFLMKCHTIGQYLSMYAEPTGFTEALDKRGAEHGLHLRELWRQEQRILRAGDAEVVEQEVELREAFADAHDDAWHAYRQAIFEHYLTLDVDAYVRRISEGDLPANWGSVPMAGVIDKYGDEVRRVLAGVLASQDYLQVQLGNMTAYPAYVATYGQTIASALFEYAGVATEPELNLRPHGGTNGSGPK